LPLLLPFRLSSRRDPLLPLPLSLSLTLHLPLCLSFRTQPRNLVSPVLPPGPPAIDTSPDRPDHKHQRLALTHLNPIPPNRRWRPSSLALIFSAWAILQLGGLFTPGLLDDVDSIYIQVAREMLQRHDFVTPTIDGIRFFDKPPLMYWMAAGSMHLFGIHDWAARLPLALGVLALLLAVYALGIRFYGAVATTLQRPPSAQDDRAGLYAALAMATCIGPYLYTRFYIPDILIALWMTVSVHLFLIALDRIQARPAAAKPSSSAHDSVILSEARSAQSKDPEDLSTATIPRNLSATKPSPSGQNLGAPSSIGASAPSSTGGLSARQGGLSFAVASGRSPTPQQKSKLPPSAQDSSLLPCLAFAAVTAFNLLTKGLIGVVFPVGFVLLYLAFTHRLKLLPKFHLIPSTLVFLAIGAPWHILAALRNPAVAMPPGLGLPTRAGWAWFYLYNEHIARFLGHRIPHDYGQVPIPIFWALLLLWLFPWVAFLPAALLDATRTLRSPKADTTLRFDSDADFSPSARIQLPPSPQDRALAHEWDDDAQDRRHEAALVCLLWAGIILAFFTLSSRQEYYHLPALPALALLVGGLLAAADDSQRHLNPSLVVRAGLRGSLYFLVPLGTILFVLCGYLALTAPAPQPATTLNDVLHSNPSLYTLSLGHLFDLTGNAMGFFRGPLLAIALCMFTLGPIAYIVRRRANTFAANLLIAAAMTAVLLAAHEGLVRFYPILGSKDLALAIDRDLRPGDILLNDGELTSGSGLLFYTPQSAAPLYLVNGRINGPWFGSFYPDAPKIFLNDADLAHLWSGPHRLFLLTENPEARTLFLSPQAPVHTFATSGGKTILTNR
jgi:4-amino-4-deoxy-L-arabinose transferase-like glycosyltransferase